MREEIIISSPNSFFKQVSIFLLGVVPETLKYKYSSSGAAEVGSLLAFIFISLILLFSDKVIPNFNQEYQPSNGVGHPLWNDYQ